MPTFQYSMSHVLQLHHTNKWINLYIAICTTYCFLYIVVLEVAYTYPNYLSPNHHPALYTDKSILTTPSPLPLIAYYPFHLFFFSCTPLVSYWHINIHINDFEQAPLLEDC